MLMLRSEVLSCSEKRREHVILDDFSATRRGIECRDVFAYSKSFRGTCFRQGWSSFAADVDAESDPGRLVDMFDPQEIHVLARARGNVVEVLAIPQWQHRRGYPAPTAATTFSLIPPTGRTSPRRLISPVMARSLRAG